MSLAAKSPSVQAAEPTHTTSATNHVNSDVSYRKRISARRTIRIVLRNALFAAIGRILIGILKQLAKKGLSKAFLRGASGEIFSLDPLKWAAVFGGISSYRLCMQTVTDLGSYIRLPKQVAAILAGTICSAPALVMNKTTRTDLCLYTVVRALHTFGLRAILPRLPAAMQTFNHYDVLLMCISATQITYGCLFTPSTMPDAYKIFFGKASMMDHRLMRGHSGAIRGHTSPELAAFLVENNLAPFDATSPDAPEKLCELIHPGLSCNSYAMTKVPLCVMYMGIPLYGPLRVVGTLATQRKKLRANPAKVILRGLKSVLTSSLFLGLYVACIIRVNCFGLRRGDRGGRRIALLCFFAGLPTLLEPKGRRMDLALYCGMYAIRSFLLTQYRFGRLPYPRHWFVMLVYFLSMSFLFSTYEDEPEQLNPRVFSAFRMLLGESKPSSKTGAAASSGAVAGGSANRRRAREETRAKSRSPALGAKAGKEMKELEEGGHKLAL